MGVNRDPQPAEHRRPTRRSVAAAAALVSVACAISLLAAAALPISDCEAVTSIRSTGTYRSMDSSFVPHGYVRAAAAEFNDDAEIFVGESNPLFLTYNRRLHGGGDPNTTRRFHGNGERQIYTDSGFTYRGQRIGGDPFSVSDGTLKITARPLSAAARAALAPLSEPTETAPAGAPAVEYSSGMLSTETDGRKTGGYAQREGYWEIRAKLPAGRGLWSAFWLIGQSHEHWDEVDIFEVLGHEPGRIFQNLHIESRQYQFISHLGTCSSDGFHVYGFLLDGGAAIFTIDGVKTRSEEFSAGEPLYAVINLAVGGTWPGLPDAGTYFPAILEVDYLRIYRRAGSARS